MSKKSVVKDTNAVNVAAVPALPAGNPAPVVNAPAVPASWTKSKRVEGVTPTSSQVDASRAAVAELNAATTWVDDFGSNAPDPTVIASKLSTAASWRKAWVLASRWAAYCADQRRLWENDAFTEVAELKPLFDYASTRDESIATRYSSTKLIVGARSASAQRAASTRKKARKAKAAVPDLPVSVTAPAAGSTTSR